MVERFSKAITGTMKGVKQTLLFSLIVSYDETGSQVEGTNLWYIQCVMSNLFVPAIQAQIQGDRNSRITYVIQWYSSSMIVGSHTNWFLKFNMRFAVPIYGKVAIYY